MIQFFLLLLCLFPQDEPATQAVLPIVTCSTDAELKTAWPKVKEGGTVLLANGAKFGPTKIAGFKPTGLVTIQPVDVAGAPPTFDAMIVSGSSNLAIQDVDIINKARYISLEVISGSENVVVARCLINAGYAIEDNGQQSSYRGGVNISGSSNVTFTGNEVTRTGTGIAVSKATDVTVSNNKVHETVLDCMNVANDVEDLLIEGNEFYGQVAEAKVGHHYDLLQFWSNQDATKDTSNVKILRNKFIALHPDTVPQACFGRADYVGSEQFFFRNFEVAYNLIVTKQANAIRFSDGINMDIHHNVLNYAGVDPWNTSSVTIPGIGLTNCKESKIHHNKMQSKYGYPATDTPEFFKNLVYTLPK